MGVSPNLNSIYIFGGLDWNTGAGMDDLWQFNLTSRQWTMLTGTASPHSTTLPAYGNITYNLEAPDITPGGRTGPNCFFDDVSLNFYLVSGRAVFSGDWGIV
jgi:hypothetical protein